MPKTYTGINIQWPISELILNGSKTIETRTYPIPEKYLNTEMAMIETPGPNGKFKARIVAIIKFTKCIRYKDSEDFYLDMDKHKVSPDSIWAWRDDKPKYGWKIEIVNELPNHIECKTKGIIYRKNVKIPL